MKLVYQKTGLPVQIGDPVKVDSVSCTIDWFAPPRSPASEGKITVREVNAPKTFDHQQEFYVSIVGAEWIEREDRT